MASALPDSSDDELEDDSSSVVESSDVEHEDDSSSMLRMMSSTVVPRNMSSTKVLRMQPTASAVMEKVEDDSSSLPLSLSPGVLAGIAAGVALVLLSLLVCLLSAIYCIRKKRMQVPRILSNVMVTNLQYRRSLTESQVYIAPYATAEVKIKHLEVSKVFTPVLL